MTLQAALALALTAAGASPGGPATAAPETLDALLASGGARRLGTPARRLEPVASGLAFTDAGLVVSARNGTALLLVDPAGAEPDVRVAVDPLALVGLAGPLHDGEVLLQGDDRVLRQVDPATGEVTHAWPMSDLAHGLLAVSGDGRLAGATDLFSEELLLLDLVAHEPLGGLPLGDHFLRCLALSSDGAFVAAGDLDGTLRVFERATGAVVYASAGDSVSGVAFRPDDGLLAVGREGDLAFVDTATWERADGLSGWDGEPLAPVWSADGERLYFGTEYGWVWGLELATATAVLHADTGAEGAVALALSPDGALVAAGCSEGRVRVFDSATGAPRLEPDDAHGQALWSVDWTAGGLASLDWTGTLCRWDLEAGRGALTPLGQAPYELALLADGTVVTGGSGGPLVRVPREGEATTLAALEEDAACLAVDAARGRLLVGDFGSRVWLHDLASGALVGDVGMPRDLSAFEVCLFDGGARFACGLEDGGLATFTLADGELAGDFATLVELHAEQAGASEQEPAGEPAEEPEEQRAGGAARAPQGPDDELDAADLAELLAGLGYLADDGDEGTWCAGLADAGGGRLAVGLGTGEVALVDGRDGRLLATVLGAGDPVQDVTSHLGAQRIAVANGSGVVLADLEGAILRRVAVPRGAQALAFAPDGATLAVGLDDGTVALLDL